MDEPDCEDTRPALELEVEPLTEPLTVPTEVEETASATELVKLILAEEAERSVDDVTTEEDAEPED